MDAAGEDFEYLDSDFEQGDEELEFVESFMYNVYIFFSVYVQNLRNGRVCIMTPPSQCKLSLSFRHVHDIFAHVYDKFICSAFLKCATFQLQ